MEPISHSSKRSTEMEESQYPCVFANLLPPVTVELTLRRTYNDPGEGGNFINGTGAVDLYGFVSIFTPYSSSDSRAPLTSAAGQLPTRHDLWLL